MSRPISTDSLRERRLGRNLANQGPFWYSSTVSQSRSALVSSPREGWVTELTTVSDSKLRCPGCGGPDVRRSQSRGMLDSIMKMARKSPFRCRGCSRRFYRRDKPEPQSGVDEGKET